MFLEVIKAEYLDGFRLLLWFSNGEQKIVDLSNSLNGTVYAPLKDIEYFKCFSIKFNKDYNFYFIIFRSYFSCKEFSTFF